MGSSGTSHSTTSGPPSLNFDSYLALFYFVLRLFFRRRLRKPAAKRRPSLIHVSYSLFGPSFTTTESWAEERVGSRAPKCIAWKPLKISQILTKHSDATFILHPFLANIREFNFVFWNNYSKPEACGQTEKEEKIPFRQQITKAKWIFPTFKAKIRIMFEKEIYHNHSSVKENLYIQM